MHGSFHAQKEEALICQANLMEDPAGGTFMIPLRPGSAKCESGSHNQATPLTGRSRALAAKLLKTGKETATAVVNTRHELCCPAMPDGQAIIGHGHVHVPDSCSVSSNQQLWSFMMGVDDSQEQQIHYPYLRRHAKHQYHNEELFGMSDSHDSNCSIQSFLQPAQNTQLLDVSCSASCHTAFLSLLADNEVPQCWSSQSSLVGNAQPLVLSPSVGNSGDTWDEASMFSFTSENMDEESPLPGQKQAMNSNVLAVSSALPPAMNCSVWSIGDYELGQKLHNGHACQVFSARCNASGQQVVLKVYRLAGMCGLKRCQLFREIGIHAKLQHKNIVQFHCAFMEDNYVVIVQEYATGGNLLHYMYRMGGRLTEATAVQKVLQPLLCALHYLHTQGIVHRDIKPEKCQLTGDMVLQIADFGRAVDLKEEGQNKLTKMRKYMAPEVLHCQAQNQSKTVPDATSHKMAADLWAVGVFGYELLCGNTPFRGNEMMDTAQNIMEGDVHFPKGLTPAAVDFISSCLQPNPASRPTTAQMLHHPRVKTFMRPMTLNDFQQTGASATSQRRIPYVGRPSAQSPAVNPPAFGLTASARALITQPDETSPRSPRETSHTSLPLLSSLALSTNK